MNSQNIEKLVHDTLYYRQRVPDTCLQVNLAGLELAVQQVEALAMIEHVLNTVVVAAPTQAPIRQDSAIGPMIYVDDPFPGLDHLLGAYMQIGSKHDIARAVDFLRNLPPGLQARAVELIPVFFRKAACRPQEKEVNERKPYPDEQLLVFVREASESDNQLLRETALRTMSFFLM